jgi:ankyrin repeat protein
VLAAHLAKYNGNEALQAPSVDTILYRAASVGFVKLAEALLKRGADVNRGCTGQRTRTPYMYAAQEGHLAMLDLLQQYGADVNAVASDGGTALDVAISSGQTLVAKCMIRHGVNVNPHLGLDDNTSPLYGAAINGHLDIVKALLGADAQPCCTATDMLENVLHNLNDDAAVPMLKLLLQHWGTDVNTVCDNGGTLIFAAVFNQRLKAACYLVSAGADLYAKNVHSNTLAHIAAQYNAVRILRWLVVTHKLNPCEPAADGLLPLHCACCYDQAAAVEYLLSLLQAAAMLAAESKAGYTALHCDADSEHDDVVQLLLRKEAAVDAKGHDGQTPLMYAQRMRTVTALVNAHADVIAVDSDNYTVLHHCAKQATAECVYKLLLKHGAVPTAVDKNGSTPAHIAGMSGHFADEALLSKAADDYSKAHANDAAAGAVNSGEQKQRDGVNDTTSSGSGCSSSTASSGGQGASGSSNSGIRGSSSNEAAAAADSETVEASSKQKKPKVKQPCANCKKLTTKLCRRCAAVHYCSTECQKVCFKDAKHRAQCADIASAIV